MALIGTVGRDIAGASMLANAKSFGVDVTYVGIDGDTSGRTLVEVDASGDKLNRVCTGRERVAVMHIGGHRAGLSTLPWC